MTLDFGLQRVRRRPRSFLVAAGVAIAIFCGLFAMISAHDRQEAIAKARIWTVEGPACPTVPLAAVAGLADPPQQAFESYDVRFARASGSVSCNMIKSDGGRGFDLVPVCVFNSPDAIEVKTSDADLAFGPGLYGPTVVSVTHGQPRCVVAPRERMKALAEMF